jgi:hypothetical protein
VCKLLSFEFASFGISHWGSEIFQGVPSGVKIGMLAMFFRRYGRRPYKSMAVHSVAVSLEKRWGKHRAQAPRTTGGKVA